MRWCELENGATPELALIFAIPNGTATSERIGARMKAEGVKKGVPDLMLPVPRGGYSGLFIEMKTPTGHFREEQRRWCLDLRNQSYAVEVCRSFAEALEVVRAYLKETYEPNALPKQRKKTEEKKS